MTKRPGRGLVFGLRGGAPVRLSYPKACFSRTLLPLPLLPLPLPLLLPLLLLKLGSGVWGQLWQRRRDPGRRSILSKLRRTGDHEWMGTGRTLQQDVVAAAAAATTARASV
jgi:hypothetical protein